MCEKDGAQVGWNSNFRISLSQLSKQRPWYYTVCFIMQAEKLQWPCITEHAAWLVSLSVGRMQSEWGRCKDLDGMSWEPGVLISFKVGCWGLQ